jgi:hypothetical protein
MAASGKAQRGDGGGAGEKMTGHGCLSLGFFLY